MVTRRSRLALVIALGLAGCKTAPIAPPPPPRAAHPQIDKTYGGVLVSPDGGFAISYKDLRVAVDPAPRTLSAMAPQLDFLLLTSAGGTSAERWPPEIRRDLKVVAPTDAVDVARKAGFLNAKALSTGQRLMLSKPGVFLFVSAVQSRNASTGALVNGYLLEFDNGRNVFISGDLVDLAPLREFVYGLRDDGKQLQLAFVNAAKAPASGAPLRSADEGMAAEMTALLGPQVAAIIDRGGLDRSKLQDAFTNQIFDGQWYVPPPSETVPF